MIWFVWRKPVPTGSHGAVRGQVLASCNGWHTGQNDDSGRSLVGDFNAQCRQTFRNLAKTLAEVGSTLSDIVTMTVFLIDARYTTRMTEIRSEIFGHDFSGSAAITVTGFAQPDIMIEIQGVAVPT